MVGEALLMEVVRPFPRLVLRLLALIVLHVNMLLHHLVLRVLWIEKHVVVWL